MSGNKTVIIISGPTAVGKTALGIEAASYFQTEIISAQQAIICTRRPRSIGEVQPLMLHMMRVNKRKINHVSY